GIGHGLHDDGSVAAHANAANIDGHRAAAWLWPSFGHVWPPLPQDVPDRTAGVNATGSASPLAAMRADAGDLDHRRFRHEAGSARGRRQCRGHVLRLGLPYCAVALTDQEYHERSSGMIVHASD